jgi:hypothetical protein
MPKVIKHQDKYKGCELACGKILRSDKWSNTVNEHGSKLRRGLEIRKVIAINEDTGLWQLYNETNQSQQQVSNS